MFTFRENAPKVVVNEDFWYALTEGYIPFKRMLDAEGVSKLKEAMYVLERFRAEAERAGLLEWT